MAQQAYSLDRIFDYRHVPTVREFSECDKFIRLITGPFGSGKSSGCVMEIFNRSCEQTPWADGVRRSRWAIIRNTMPQLQDTTMKTFFYWFPKDAYGIWNETKHLFIMKFPLDDGTSFECEILFRALDNPDHVRNLLSLELTGLWFNELREIPHVIFDTAQGRVGRFPPPADGGCTWQGIIADTNPPDTEHWIYKLFEEELPDNAAIFHQPSGISLEAENVPNLPKNYYKNLAIGKDAGYIDVYIHGKYGYTRQGKPIYHNYNDSVHCAKEPIAAEPESPLIVSFDFGTTPACVLTQLNRKGQFVILDEICTQSMGLEQLVKELFIPLKQSKYPRFKYFVTGDPGGSARSQNDEITCFQILKKLGFPAATPAWTNLWTPRFNAIDHYLTSMVAGQPAFILSPNCKTLRKGFISEYKWRKIQVVGEDRYSDKPNKNIFSHIQDAAQYAALAARRGEQNNIRQSELMSTVVPQIVPSPNAWS